MFCRPPDCGQLRDSDIRILHPNPIPVYKSKQEEERNLKRILEAEDKALDREIAGKL